MPNLPNNSLIHLADVLTCAAESAKTQANFPSTVNKHALSKSLTRVFDAFIELPHGTIDYNAVNGHTIGGDYGIGDGSDIDNSN